MQKFAPSRRAVQGVTLIELLVVVVIVGILTAIAYPSYREHVNRTRRSDGTAALLNVAQRLERCFTQFNSYNNAGCAVALPIDSSEGFYEIGFEDGPSATAYQLSATPKGPQAGDACGTLMLTHAGARSVTGDASAKCW